MEHVGTFFEKAEFREISKTFIFKSNLDFNVKNGRISVNNENF